jgi:hypothetical protein
VCSTGARVHGLHRSLSRRITHVYILNFPILSPHTHHT